MVTQVISANGKSKQKGSFTPNFNHKYDKVGASIMRELHKHGSMSINPKSEMHRHVVIMLVRLQLAKKTEMLGMWLVEPANLRIHYEPKIGRRDKKAKKKWTVGPWKKLS